MKTDVCLDLEDGTNEKAKFPRVYYDTPTGEPLSVTEEEFNKMVEAFRQLAAIRDRNKTSKQKQIKSSQS